MSRLDDIRKRYDATKRGRLMERYRATEILNENAVDDIKYLLSLVDQQREVLQEFRNFVVRANCYWCGTDHINIIDKALKGDNS